MQQSLIEPPRLRLVPFAPEHLTERYVSWLNDPEVVRYSEQRHRRHTITTCDVYRQSFEGTSHLFWAIVANAPDDCHIGNMNAYVDSYNGVADLGLLIGERHLWGRGYGLEAWNAAIRFLFGIQSLRKITAGTMSVNTGMLKIMERSGMSEEGRRRRQYLFEGKEVDIIYTAIFKDEWIERFRNEADK